MTIKEAILKSLEDLQTTCTHNDIFEHISRHNYYIFTNAKTPTRTISSELGNFIRNNDTRIKRVKGDGNYYLYYLAKFENTINELPSIQQKKTRQKSAQSFYERDLHLLLSSFLQSKNIFSKTILHETSKNSKDEHQKWIHPDMVGVEFTDLSSTVTRTFMKLTNKADAFTLTSYEIKKEIKTDYELKKYFFQAVSNSSWANYGYLVAFDINDNLKSEIERLNQSFGIGIIELKANPYESKTLFQAQHKELDFKTIDKLCKVNPIYENFIEIVEKMLSADERYYQSLELELTQFCDNYFENDSEIKKYCKEKNIPFSIDEES
jgi:hypothetical protein